MFVDDPCPFLLVILSTYSFQLKVVTLLHSIAMSHTLFYFAHHILAHKLRIIHCNILYISFCDLRWELYILKIRLWYMLYIVTCRGYNLEFYRLDLKKYSLVYKLLYIVFSTIYIVEFYGNQKNHFGRNKGFVSIIKYELETGDTVFYS